VDLAAGSWHVGPDGGVIHEGSVTVVIPPDALDRTAVFDVRVDAGGDLVFTPDLVLASPAIIGFAPADPSFGLDDAPDTAGSPPDARVYFQARHLASFHLPEVAPFATPLGLDAAPWAVRERTGAIEADFTQAPPVEWTEIGPECLVSAADLVDGRFDRAYRVRRREREPDEATTLSREARDALATASALVPEALPGYRLWLNGAWDSSGAIHGSTSFHNLGAAVDLTLASWNGRRWVKARPADPAVLGRLPALLQVSGFTWVWFENRRHVHASITSPSLIACRPELAEDVPEDPVLDDDLGLSWPSGDDPTCLATDDPDALFGCLAAMP